MSYFQCVILPAVIIVLLVIAGVNEIKAQQTYQSLEHDERPTIVRMYTMDRCPFCDEIKATLLHHRVVLTNPIPINQLYEASGFPTIVYSDGTNDNGDKIRKRLVRWPEEPVTLYHYKGF